MNTNAMNRDVWPGMLRLMTYGLTLPNPPPLEQVDWAFKGAIDHPNATRTRNEFLVAVRAGLASDVDISAELHLAHPDSAVREFLAAVEKRLSNELGQ